MPKITKTRIGQVYLREVEPRKWRASWTDPATKRHVRRVLPAASFKEAETQAKGINSQLAQGRGFRAKLRGSSGHAVSDAVLEAVNHTDANPKTRRQYLHMFNPFAEYLAANAKGIAAWGDVSEAVLENYIEHCRKQSVSHDTIRLRLFVLRLTARFMARTYPTQYRNVAGGIRLRRHDPPKAEIDMEASILAPVQMRLLLAWLTEHDEMVSTWATLQGLCGLRLYEAAYLCEADIDPDRGTVTVRDNSGHKPKNRPSYRTVPVPSAAMNVLAHWQANMAIRHAEGFLFFPANASRGATRAKSDQARAGVYTTDYISHRWAKSLRKARLAGLQIPEKFVPRKLRGSFVTALRAEGADLALLQAYIGHSATTVLSAHYDRVSLDRLRSIADLSQEKLATVEKDEKRGFGA